MNNDLYEPVIFSKPGICPKCKVATLCIHSLEYGYMMLDQMGVPKHDFSTLSFIAECPKCGFKSDLYVPTKDGFRPASPYTRQSPYQSDNISIEERTFKGNPFVIDEHPL